MISCKNTIPWPGGAEKDHNLHPENWPGTVVKPREGHGKETNQRGAMEKARNRGKLGGAESGEE